MSIMRRNVSDPRALAAILEKAEAELAARRHPDPYIREYFPLLNIIGKELTVLQLYHLLAESNGMSFV